MATEQHYLDPLRGHGPFARQTGTEPPSIVLISMDMVPPEFHLPGCSGMHTPTLTALRRQHICFSHAFATSPLCAPARAALLTGRHSYITTNSERAHDGHAFHLRAGDPIFPEYLRAAGYRVRHVGKCHVGAEAFMRAFGENATPWDRWSPPWYDDDGYAGFLHDQGLKPFTFAREIVGRSLTGRGRGNSYGGWIAPQGGRSFPTSATYPAYLVQRAIRALSARAEDTRPFYLQLDFFAPHQPFAIPGDLTHREAVIRRQTGVPASYAEIKAREFAPPAGEPRVYSLYRRNWGLQDEATVIDYRVANQLQFELLDTLIGRLFRYLQEQDLYDDTWIFVVADHGEMNAEGGLIDKGAYLNPRVLRVPLLVKPARGFLADRAPVLVNTPVSLLDLAPTVFELTGIRPATRLDGRSLLATVRERNRPEDLPVLFEVWSHVIPNPCVGTVFTADDGQDYLYSFNATDPEDELYAVEVTPLRNLWPEPSAVALRRQAVRCLHARLAADPRWKGYQGFLELTYPEEVAASGDRQLFV